MEFIEKNTEGVYRVIRYLALGTFRSSTTFEGTQKTLAGKYGAVLQKIRLECSGSSASLQTIKFVKLQYDNSCTARILTLRTAKPNAISFAERLLLLFTTKVLCITLSDSIANGIPLYM